MKTLNQAKKTRLKAMLYTNIFLAAITIYAINVGLETVATTAIAGILTITTMFIGGDSFRKSDGGINETH